MLREKLFLQQSDRSQNDMNYSLSNMLQDGIHINDNSTTQKKLFACERGSNTRQLNFQLCINLPRKLCKQMNNLHDNTYNAYVYHKACPRHRAFENLALFLENGSLQAESSFFFPTVFCENLGYFACDNHHCQSHQCPNHLCRVQKPLPTIPI